MRINVVVMTLLLSVACAPSFANFNAVQSTTDELKSVVRDYKTWVQMFDAPRNVSMQLMLLCRLPDANEQAYLQSEHAQYFVQVYVNSVGEKLMRAENARVFPIGAVIVKEKWKRDASSAQDPHTTKPSGLGIMVKRENAWQYAYMDEQGAITRDQTELEHCSVCHGAQSERDSVFFPNVLSE